MLKYAIIASVCCLTCGVNAETVLLRDYKEPKNEEFKAFNELYLAGVKEGLLTSNAKLAMDGKPKLLLATEERGDRARGWRDYYAPGKHRT
jgi:hypothetical protein